MDFLYKMGFFGKGSLSRSRPEYNENFRWAAITKPDNQTIYPRIVNKQWYLRHLQWAGEDVSEEDLSTGELEFHDTNMEGGHCQKINLVSQESHVISFEETVTEIENKTSWVLEEDDRFWNDSVNEQNNVVTGKTLSSVEWDEGDGDADFWNSAETVNANKDNTVGSHHGTTNIPGNQSCKTDGGGSHSSTTKISGSLSHKTDADSQNSNATFNVKEDINAVGSHRFATDVSGSLSCKTKGERTQYVSEESSSCSPNKKARLSTADSSPETFHPLLNEETSEEPVNKSEKSENENSSVNNCNIKINVSKTETDLTSYDPMCHHDDIDSDLFVIPNEHFSETSKYQPKNKLKWKPVLKRNPYPIKEYLQLSFVEAFFLSYGLGCFVVKENENVLDLTSMWRIFCTRQKNFIPSYVTYHYFRSKGWVPKSGLKFGCDYILYKVGPPFYHGSYSVIIQFVTEDSLTVIPEFQQRRLSWRSLCGLNRITEHVGKEVMIFYVIKPMSMSQDDLMKPSCIPNFKVKEVLLSRWVSSQERQTKEPEEIP